MIRLIVYIVAIGLIAAAVAWLADRPGEIVMTWQGYRIETSVMAAGLMVLALVFLALLVWSIVRMILHGPDAFSGFLRARRRDRAYQALSRGMIAVGSGDAKLATRYADQAGRVLSDEPLALLLKAQTAQLKGDREAARKAFETMAATPETESLGLRGLFIEAQRRGDTAVARGYVEAALKSNRATAWAAEALFDMQSSAGDWQGALTTLQANLGHRLIGRGDAKRQRAVLMTGQAMELVESDRDEALRLAQEAHNLAPDMVPAAAIAGRLLGEDGNVRRAVKVLERAWREAPHPDLAEAYANVRPGDSARDRLKRMKALAQKTPDNVEGTIAVAEAAIDARDWQAAREALAPHLQSRPSQRLCSLMAEIEEGEHGDKGRVREWLARAVRAPRDPAWVADGIVSESWAPVSPVTGRIDAFQWRVPVERIGAPEGRDEDEELLDAPPPGDIVEVPAVAEAGEQEAAAVRPAAKTAAKAPAPRQHPAAEPAAGRPPKAAESSGPPGDGAAAAVAESPEAAQTGEDRVEPPPAAPAQSAKLPPARKGDTKVTASDDATAAVTEKTPEKAPEKGPGKAGDKASEAAAPRPPDDPGPEHSGLDDEDAAYRRS